MYTSRRNLRGLLIRKIKLKLLRIPLGVFLFGGIEMAIHKCRGCIWGKKISNELILCMFPNCVKKDSNKTKSNTNKSKTPAKAKRRKVYVSY
jgi:hypothetical protein